MVTVPGVMPVTRPVVELMVAIEVLLLLHVPPPEPEVRVIVTVLPGHTLPGPEIVPGEVEVPTVSG